MRIAIVSGVAAALLGAMAARSAADVGPIEPARQVCMGSPEGGPCTLDGKSGTCHGPHPSRMYCQTDKPASDGSAAASSTIAQPAGSAAPATEPAAPTPAQKRGCAVSEPASAALVGLAAVALGLGRRRRRA